MLYKLFRLSSIIYALSSIIYALSRKYHKRADARRRGGGMCVEFWCRKGIYCLQIGSAAVGRMKTQGRQIYSSEKKAYFCIPARTPELWRRGGPTPYL